MKRSTHAPLLALLLLAPAPLSAQSFAPLPGFERVRGARAVAFDPTRGLAAVGTGSSVWVAPSGAPATRVLRPGEVRDLAFDSDGALWVASDRGVGELRAGVLREHPFGAGASGRATRLLVAGERVLAGSEDGLWIRARADEPFVRVDGAAPEGELRALASAAEGVVFVALAGDVARIVFTREGEAERIDREVLPPGDGEVLDLAACPDGSVVALRERALALRAAGDARWERVAISLPPGAVPARIASAGDALWIATDRGALVGPAPGGPYVRAPAPAGALPVAALAVGGDVALLAGPKGVLRGRARSADGAAGGAPTDLRPPAQDPREPSVQAVQRAALDYLAMHPRDLASLRARPRRSALAPTLELFGAYGGDRHHELDWDETFTSGVDRTFFDRNQDHGRVFDAGVSLRWDLGAAIYHAEEIDAAREAREWIELRDEVLDELAQLYFERRRTLLELAAERDALAAERLRLRAAELAAGLDAWTGGWWSAQSGAAGSVLSPPGPTQEQRP